MIKGPVLTKTSSLKGETASNHAGFVCQICGWRATKTPKNHIFFGKKFTFFAQTTREKVHTFCITFATCPIPHSDTDNYQLSPILKAAPCNDEISCIDVVFFWKGVCDAFFFKGEDDSPKTNKNTCQEAGPPKFNSSRNPNRKKSSLQKASIFRWDFFMVQKSHSQPTENWMVLKPPCK